MLKINVSKKENKKESNKLSFKSGLVCLASVWTSVIKKTALDLSIDSKSLVS